MSRFVMIIDDSLTVRKILDVCLRRAGYETRCFTNGVEALRWLAEAEACIPALVFVDLGLPKLDGYGIIRLLTVRPAFKHTAFVIISRRNGLLDRLKGRLAGADAYLTKPCRTQEILAAVQACLGTPVDENTDTAAVKVAHAIGNLRIPAHAGK